MSDEKKTPEGTTQGTPQGAESAEDLFDLMGDEGKKHKKKEEKKPEQKHPAAKKPEPRRFPEGVEVRYSGHRRALPREMTEAEVFEFLEDDFPELSAERAELRYDAEKNRLVPVLKAHKKGAHSPLVVLREPPDRGSYPPVFRVFGTDGVYEVRKTLLGTFVARMEPGVPVREGFYPCVPKAPASLLAKTVRIFAERPDREALVCVVFDRREGEFHLVWAEQEATASGVTYEPLPENERFVVYAEIHSHHGMPAFFSATDDEHEKKSGVYGVVGRVDKPRPQAHFRYSCGGIFRPLRAESLFEPVGEVRNLVEQPS